jgi:hypothetical protein
MAAALPWSFGTVGIGGWKLIVSKESLKRRVEERVTSFSPRTV